MEITQEQLEVAAKAAAKSEFDRDWRSFLRATEAAFKAIGVTVKKENV